ncbi:DUF6090 family protein [Winogradskyella tangerina]|uniref:DUF6090 family protein n=1 Tax=Winogradskyella tangerina TaxID=2023240 RepID=UPI000DBE709E|nr:DUF6090 family protein [Winogradskyella tangerina]
MIKFFRQIRFKLMSENNTSKYFKYAFGEILLVVVGILIALGINNWNEGKKSQKNESVLIKKLQEENIINLESIEGDTEYRTEIPEILTEFNLFLANANLEEQNDSLQYYISEIFRSTSYTFTQSNLINYVNVYNSEFSELNKELATLQAFQNDLQSISEKGIDIKIENFFDALKNDVDFNSLEIVSYDTLSSLKFRNNIIIIQSVESEITYQYLRTIKQTRKVDSLISQRLNQ